MINSLKMVLILSVTVLLVNCAHTPPDVEVCIRLSKGAQCAFTISPETRRLTEAQWQEIKLGRMSLTSNGYAEYRLFVERVCAVDGACVDVDVQDLLNIFEKSLLEGEHFEMQNLKRYLDENREMDY